ncbi:hypothetical protein N7533_005157 [Penicillium manginii]|uniref:uncharacterized protein n=1 Tax=Penicillium manginii TaxID=203109 RepID=UPI002548125E|nr:uncharacterized protein N7533_005157 [Penicillium manginii]KAJ5755614.1 hypothetical protein N7533_005157 [Penicillium manginii]
MHFSLLTLLTVCAHVTALPELLGRNGRCDRAACESFAHESGWANQVSTSWCTSTLTATVTTTNAVTTTDTITATATVTTTDAVTTTDTVTSTATVTTTDAVTTTATISVTTTCTQTITSSGAWGTHGSGNW